jgi:hypothetical protein
MSNIVISKELFSSGLACPKGTVVDFSKPNSCIKLLESMKKDSLTIYDITENIKFNHEEGIPIKDQVNCTGSNPLVGRQAEMGIDFIDMSHVFKQISTGVITHSCGKSLDLKFEFPTHYFAHITIIARALNFQTVTGWLINKNNTN